MSGRKFSPGLLAGVLAMTGGLAGGGVSDPNALGRRRKSSPFSSSRSDMHDDIDERAASRTAGLPHNRTQETERRARQIQAGTIRATDEGALVARRAIIAAKRAAHLASLDKPAA